MHCSQNIGCATAFNLGLAISDTDYIVCLSDDCSVGSITYQKMIDYVNGLGDYWIRLVEQMVPATTLWNTGIRLENNVLNRQKFVWRRQLRSELVAVPCTSCSVTGTLLPVNCPVSSISCGVYPWLDDLRARDTEQRAHPGRPRRPAPLPEGEQRGL